MSLYITTPLGADDINSFGVYLRDNLEDATKTFNYVVEWASETDELGRREEYCNNPAGFFLIEVPNLTIDEYEKLFGDDKVLANFELVKAITELHGWFEAFDYPETLVPDDHDYYENNDISEFGEPMAELAGAKIIDQWQSHPVRDLENYIDVDELFRQQGGEVDEVTQEEIAEYYEVPKEETE